VSAYTGLTAGLAARAAGGRLVGADGATPIARAVIDSREASGGSLFAAIAGSRADGHDFAAAAIARGAALVLADRPVEAPHLLVDDVTRALGEIAKAHLAALRAGPRPPAVLAVTGSVGKTTTKDLLARLGAAMGPTVAAKGSFNNHLGLPLTVLAATPTTRFLVVEMGANHRGEIAALAGICPPDIGIVLAVAPAHVGEFGSLEAVAAAKAELPAALSPEATAILNLDDPLVASMATPAQVTGFGIRPDAIVRVEGASVDDAGRLTADLATPLGPLHVATALIGIHQAMNLAAACAGAMAMGADLGTLEGVLTGIGADSPHRMALREISPTVRLLDDSYNANPASSAAALHATADLAAGAGGQAWAVLGEMAELGDAARQAHRDLGALAARLGFHRLIVVGERARGIADGALDAGMDAGAIQFCEVPPGPEDIGMADARNAVIVVKGSNSTGLWRLAEALDATQVGGGEPAGPSEGWIETTGGGPAC
jgi:UDP-N-acetylmuramoyl-tripeptide--D-alanyl-D-alanine ligase